MKNNVITLILILGIFSQSCGQTKKEMKPASNYKISKNEKQAIFASGCFWCVEAIFESVNGINEVVSGYSGGKATDATYDKVSGGWTNHAEAVAVYYDPAIIDYNTLLQVFFGSHDPTTHNRQGPDAGRQYRSAIFYADEAEKLAAEAFVEKLYAEAMYRRGTITTEISKLDAFYPAEVYHQNFEKNNPDYPYVQAVSVPRLMKFQSKFPHLLKSKGNQH